MESEEITFQHVKDFTAYLLAGSISMNPQMLAISTIILIAGFNAGKIGFDYCVVPWLKADCRLGKAAIWRQANSQ